MDPAKRSQLGAHYTDPATIQRLIEPVIRRPLIAEWAAHRSRIVEQLARRDALRTAPLHVVLQLKAEERAAALREADARHQARQARQEAKKATSEPKA